jgi:hypothetical protein
VFERELTLYKFSLGYLNLLAADIEESAMGKAAYEGGNPPVWILGHLAVAADSAARILGLERTCPREWNLWFRPGSNPADLKPPLPSKEELLGAIDQISRRIFEAAPGASPEAMNQPHAVDILKRTPLKTNGDVMAHLLCTHPFFHLAQLSACRRSGGKGPIV